MQKPTNRFVPLFVALLAGTVCAPAAWAQYGTGPISPMQASGANNAKPDAKPLAPPPALPGAQSNKDTVVPLSRQAGEMGPTEALFDAVNRGDIAAARDAISRGADLDGRNMLGLTPLDLAVDIGRNDIAFLLLSLRGGQPASGPARTAAAAGKAALPARPSTVAAAKPAPAKLAPARAAQVQPTMSRQFASDGGTPIPNAGFLGFGGGKSEH